MLSEWLVLGTEWFGYRYLLKNDGRQPNSRQLNTCYLTNIVKTGIHSWQRKCQSLYPLKSVVANNLWSGRDPGGNDEHADELPWDVFLQLAQKWFDCTKQLLHYLSGRLVSTILHTNTLDVEIVGWCGYTSSAVVRPVRYTAIILGNDIGDALETFWLLYSYFILLIYFIKWWQNVPSSLVKCNSPIFFLL